MDGAYSLDQARDKAREYLGIVASGRDPLQQVDQARAGRAVAIVAAQFEAEYVSQERFPLSNSQSGLPFEQQQKLDAVNLDELQAAVARGDTLTAKQQAFLFELTEKRRLWADGPTPDGP